MSELEHWIAAEAGADGEPEDGFLWLDPRHTGGQGHLWLLVDGVGAAPDAVSALVAITVTELYPEALDLYRDPLRALEVAIRDADRRLDAIRQAYPSLLDVRASFVGVALFEGAYHVAWAGSGRAYRVVGSVVTRLTEDRVESVKSGVVLPSTGVGSGAAVIHQAGSFEIQDAAIVLATDGVARSLRDQVVGQGAERLRAWDAVTSFLELSRLGGRTGAAAVAVIRATQQAVRTETSPAAFRDWAESGASDWSSKTLVLQTGTTEAPGKVPVTNYPKLPPISGAADPDEAEQLKESTMTFSPEEVRAIVKGSTSEVAPTDSIRSEEVVAALRQGVERTGPVREPSSPAGTMMFSPQEIAGIRGSSADELADTGDPSPVEETRAFSPEPEGTALFSPSLDAGGAGRVHEVSSKDVSSAVRSDGFADDTETWRGDSLTFDMAAAGRSRWIAVLIGAALIGGAVAAYLAFGAG